MMSICHNVFAEIWWFNGFQEGMQPSAILDNQNFEMLIVDSVEHALHAKFSKD